jgi:hypothetical protein
MECCIARKGEPMRIPALVEPIRKHWRREVIIFNSQVSINGLMLWNHIVLRLRERIDKELAFFRILLL